MRLMNDKDFSVTREISDLQKKRARNQIWNAAADYGFTPDFKYYTTEGKADVYWNSLFGLAHKHYDYARLSALFRGLEHEEEAGEYEALQRKREAVEKEKKERAEKKEALETFYRELEELEVAFTPQRWNAIVEKVVVGTDGEMTVHFVNGGEVVV